jgi:uncharacterized membrane protein
VKRIGKFLARGIDALLPIGVTVYVIYWLAYYGDKFFGDLVYPVVPENYFWPGVGLMAGVSVLFLVGLFASILPGRLLFGAIERICMRIPLVKTVFRSTQDFTRLFISPHEGDEFGEVVWVPIGDMHVIGFITRGPTYGSAKVDAKDRIVAVYISMSAGIGGFTVYLPRSKLEPTGLTVEEAMRLVMTAGVSTTERTRAEPPPSA